MHLVKEAVDEQRLDIRHCNTKNMIAEMKANGFSKGYNLRDNEKFTKEISCKK
jgi:hypothetical protein